MPPYYQIKYREDVAAVFERERPWLASGAIDFLDTHLNETMIGAEFGGGGSTPWLCARLKQLFTFEADPNWSIGLIDHMAKSESLRKKWSLHYVNCTWHTDTTGEINIPKGFWTNRLDSLSREEQRQMERAMFEIELPGPIDFALVDGAVRYSALRKVAEWMRTYPSMMVVVDNSDGVYGDAANKAFPDTHERLDFIDTNPENISRGATSGQTSIWRPR